MVLALSACATEPEGGVLVVDEPATEMIVYAAAIETLRFEPVETISCDCQQPEDLTIDDEWIKTHSPGEIAMVFSMMGFFVAVNQAGDYSEICCSVLRKLK